MFAVSMLQSAVFEGVFMPGQRLVQQSSLGRNLTESSRPAPNCRCARARGGRGGRPRPPSLVERERESASEGACCSILSPGSKCF